VTVSGFVTDGASAFGGGWRATIHRIVAVERHPLRSAANRSPLR